MGNMINHDQPTICWMCPIFRGCFVCAMQQRYGGSCLFNQTKWSEMSMARMALFKLTRQWQDRKAISMFVVSGNTLATRQFPLLKVWVALSIMLSSRLCWRGLERKFQRVALKRWVAFGHVWFFSAPFAGSGSDRTNATTSRASRTARYDGRGDLSKRLSSAGRWSPQLVHGHDSALLTLDSGIQSGRTMGPLQG